MATKSVAVRLSAVGGKQVKAELQGIGKAGADGVKGLNTQLDAASVRLGKFGVASGSALRAVKGMAIGFAAALGPAAIFGGAVAEAEKFETLMLRMNGIIRATGGAAGRSAEQLRDQAQSLARDTLASTEGVMQAQQTLLTFRKVQGDVFDSAIVAANDMSAALGGDLNSATLQLAKALEDPVKGLTALSRSGTVFTEDQKALVKQMVETGRTADAQRFILSELEAQYGGAAKAAAQGLAGAQDGVAQSFQEVKLAIADSFGVLSAATGLNRGLDQALQFLTRNMDMVRGISIAAAAALTIFYAPAIVTATGATVAWIASLITLRGALLATGIGALVVGAGMLIKLFFDLVEGAGGFGAAMTLLGEVASGVWEGIKTSASSLVPALGSVFERIKGGFMSMLAFVQNKWGEFLQEVGGQMAASAIPGVSDVGSELFGSGIGVSARASATEVAAARANAKATELMSEAASLVTTGFEAAREAAGRLAETVARAGENSDTALTGAADVAAALGDTLDGVADAAAGAGAAGKKAGKDTKDGAEEAKVGWDAVLGKLNDYVTEARDIGAGIGDVIAGAFRSGEDAVGEFVKTGKLSVKDMVTSMIADLAKLAARRFIFGPLAGALGNALGGVGGGFGAALQSALAPAASFAGGGHTGYGARAGGLDGRGGFLAMMHPQERVIDEARGQRGGGREMAPVVVNIQTRDVESFRQSRTQVAADIARAVSMGRRGM